MVESGYSSLPYAFNEAFDYMALFPAWPFAPLFVSMAERRVGLDISQVDSARDLALLQPEQAVFIMHGTNDRLFPYHHAQKMYNSAHQPKELWLIKGLGHASPVHEHKEEFKKRVISFFEAAFNSNKE